MNRIFKILLLLLTVSLTCNANAGGHVGTGAGIVEHNVFYAYVALPKAVRSCLEFPTLCPLDPSMREDLEKILQIAEENSATSERIQFLTEREAGPRFFNTSESETHRIAKTEFDPSAPIYWNLNQLYDDNGRPALDVPALIAILVHELGHQAEIFDHAYLDGLGARIRHLAQENFRPDLVYHGKKLNAELAILNHRSLGASADILVSDGVGSYRLHISYLVHRACNAVGGTPLGWSVVNEHWLDREPMRSPEGRLSLRLAAWLQSRCLVEDLLSEVTEDLVLQLDFVEKDGAYQFWRYFDPREGGVNFRILSRTFSN